MEYLLEEGKDFDRAIGLRIRKVRDNLGWSRERLAEEAKLSRTTIYHVENGKRGTTAESLARICLALNTASEFILFGNEDKPLLKSQRELIRDKLEESLKILDGFTNEQTHRLI